MKRHKVVISRLIWQNTSVIVESESSDPDEIKAQAIEQLIETEAETAEWSDGCREGDYEAGDIEKIV